VSARRPYIYEDREWLEIANIRERQDVQPDEVPRSELDKPWRFNNDEDDTYPTYEDDFLPCPTCGPWCPPCPDPDPVPIPGPCNQETKCGFVDLVDVPEEVECGDEYWFRTLHSVAGCDPASFGDIFLTWSIDAGEILSIDGLGMKWKAPECCDGQTVTVCVSSADGSCSSCRSFKLACLACCEEFEIVGADTVNAGSTWGGAITPPCPGAECTVSSNSGCPMECSVNPDGSSVTVGVNAKACGSFTVTVTEDTSTPQKQEDNCSGESASTSVRINGNGGYWKTCGSCSYFLCNGPFCSCTYESGEFRWRIWIGAGIFCGPCCTTACYDNWDPWGPGHPGNIVSGPVQYCASTCDTNGPCAGSSMFGTGIAYWVNPDCECI